MLVVSLLVHDLTRRMKLQTKSQQAQEVQMQRLRQKLARRRFHRVGRTPPVQVPTMIQTSMRVASCQGARQEIKMIGRVFLQKGSLMLGQKRQGPLLMQQKVARLSTRCDCACGAKLFMMITSTGAALR